VTPPARVFLFGPRACGKSTVAKRLAAKLDGWTVLDIDQEYHTRFEGAPVSEQHDLPYYAACRRILLDNIKREHVVFALGGGDLVNSVALDIRHANLDDCRRHGTLVLLLPSRFTKRTLDILFERESRRTYTIPKQFLRKELEHRLPLMRECADLIVYGTAPDQLAHRIIQRCRLK